MARVGYFMSHEQRSKEGIEFRKTHFNLGNHPSIHLSQTANTTKSRPGLYSSKQVRLR